MEDGVIVGWVFMVFMIFPVLRVEVDFDIALDFLAIEEEGSVFKIWAS